MALTRTVRFDYLDGLEVEVKPAGLEAGATFAAATVAWIQALRVPPERRAASDPRRVFDEQANADLAGTYSRETVEGKTAISATRNATPDEWEAWLLANPAEFQMLQAVAGEDDIFTDLGHSVHHLRGIAELR